MNALGALLFGFFAIGMIAITAFSGKRSKIKRLEDAVEQSEKSRLKYANNEGNSIKEKLIVVIVILVIFSICLIFHHYE